MAVRPFNSVAGFSTGDPAFTVIQANGDVTTTNLTANGVSNLGPVGNVHITGGTNGQVLQTDGSGNLTFATVNVQSNRAAPMPYNIANGDSYIVNENFQGLYSQPITIDGELVVDGMLIEINDTIFANDNQILYSFNGLPTGNTGFEFQYWSGNISVPGNINTTGNVIPAADDTYDLGRANARWRNGYFGGNTLYLDTATISVDANGYVVITNQVGGTFTVEGTEQTSTTELENGNSNVKVYANGNIAFTVSGTSNVLVATTAGANLTGNLTTTGIKTDNLYYANGNPWNFTAAGANGSNTQIQFNNSGNFGASANLTFNSSNNLLSLVGDLSVTGNIALANTSAIKIGGSTGTAGQVLTSNGTNTYWSTRFYYGDTPPNFATLNYGDIFFYIDNPNSFQRLYMWVTDGSSDYFYDFLPPSF
jgi:hypothetical protein